MQPNNVPSKAVSTKNISVKVESLHGPSSMKEASIKQGSIKEGSATRSRGDAVSKSNSHLASALGQESKFGRMATEYKKSGFETVSIEREDLDINQHDSQIMSGGRPTFAELNKLDNKDSFNKSQAT